ncbi:MAG: AraC-like DNA-binding protein [Oleispira sp.]|jgi:AraC-like DNA-binding protein
MTADLFLAVIEHSPKITLVKKTCHYLQVNISNKHMLDDVAKNMGTNRSKLAASFKDVLGLGVFEFLRKIRMEKAKLLLVMTDTPIQQVAFDVGCENSANFSTTYKKYYGLSPREQRNLSLDLKEISLKFSRSINDPEYLADNVITIK